MISTTGVGAYILAAAMMADEDCGSARATVSALGRPGRRFHWRDAGQAERHRAVGVIAGLPALHLVVIGTKLDPHRQERARRHCLRRLVHELEVAGVDQLWLESRTPRQNLRDVQAVDGFRAARIISALHVDHVRPMGEPLLWIPDIVAGAVNLALGGEDLHEVALKSLISRYDIDLG
jgi:hypothetical protein